MGCAVLLLTGSLHAQGLADYDYANLGFRGIGVEGSYVHPDNTEDTAGFGLRADLGYLGPHVRVVPRFAYWSSDIQASEVKLLESRLEELSGVTSGSIQLGSINRDAVIFGVDVQGVLPTSLISPYLGVGLDVYVLNGSGPAIDGTFVDDALDLVTAGISGVGGVQVSVNPNLRVYGEVRGTLVTDVSNVALTAGIAYYPTRQ